MNAVAEPATAAGASDLAVELAEQLGGLLGHPVVVGGLQRVAGGSAHHTWSCVLQDGARLTPLIVRCDIPDGPVEADGGTEVALLEVLCAIGIPVPRPWLRAGAITVMERIDGQDARKLMARTGAVPDARTLGLHLVDTQAAIHTATDPRLAAVLGGSVTAADEVERWAQTIAQARPGPQPLLGAAVAWLRSHVPAPARPALVHGDYKANNLLVDAAGAATVIDWEMAHLGDPVEDVAWTLLWTTRFDLVEGMLPRADYLAAYAQASGAPIDPARLFFWELFSLVKLAAIFLAGVRSGAPPLPTLALLARAVPHLDHAIAARLRDALGTEER